MQIQLLDARYIDGAALLKLLDKSFGAGNFKVDVNKRPQRLKSAYSSYF